MPIDYSKYPPDWPSIRRGVLLKARNSCEECGIRNYSLVRWDKVSKTWERASGNVDIDNIGAGICTYKESREMSIHWNAHDDDPRWITIVLTVAHLNHDITDNRPENLKALCQRHHLAYDQKLHRENAKATRDKNKGLQSMF